MPAAKEAPRQAESKASRASNPQLKRAPTLYIIITIKLIKGLLFVLLALGLYALSDNDLVKEYQNLLHHLHLHPERQFFVDLATKIGQLTEAKVVWAAIGTLAYSMFSLVEGVGLMFRVKWAGWMAIGESAFFIPIEVLKLMEHFRWPVLAILGLNIFIVWYLFQNRERLFKHH